MKVIGLLIDKNICFRQYYIKAHQSLLYIATVVSMGVECTIIDGNYELFGKITFANASLSIITRGQEMLRCFEGKDWTRTYVPFNLQGVTYFTTFELENRQAIEIAGPGNFEMQCIHIRATIGFPPKLRSASNNPAQKYRKKTKTKKQKQMQLYKTWFHSDVCPILWVSH